MGLSNMISSGILLLVSSAAGFNVPGRFSSNQRVPNSCATLTGGTCIFPFTYNGGENQGKYWCSTKVDPTGTHVNGEGNYGFCSSECSGAPREFETVSRFRSASSSSSAVSFGGASVSSRSRSPRRPF